MNTKQAKDFLVQQAAEQAALENVPLSDVETRMMYFTESDLASCPNPIELNHEFEAQYETAEYEAKISRLLHHAYDRLKVENPEKKRNWDQVIRTLDRGDHYILVLWGVSLPGQRPKGDSFKLLGSALLIVAGLGIAMAVSIHYNIDLDRYGKYFSIGFVVLVFLLSGFFRSLYKVAMDLIHRRTNEDDESI
jgi:hypothetical protein